MNKRIVDEEIRTIEKAGFKVVLTDAENNTYYDTNVGYSDEVCDFCEDLVIKSDPDPYDDFCMDDQKAICAKCRTIITGAMRPYQMKKLTRPKWCPRNK